MLFVSFGALSTKGTITDSIFLTVSVMGLIRNDGYEWVEAEVMLYDMAGGFEADEDDTEGNLMKMPAVREALGGLEEENTAVEGEGMEEQEQEQQEDVSEDVEMMDVS